MAAVQIGARVDKNILDRAGEVFAYYGLDISSAIRMFITMTANEREIPLRISHPPEIFQDARAMDEALSRAEKKAAEPDFNRHFMSLRGLGSKRPHAHTGLEQQLEARNEWPD
jgi:addiction module RelB/DinJ family antitoxin